MQLPRKSPRNYVYNSTVPLKRGKLHRLVLAALKENDELAEKGVQRKRKIPIKFKE